MHLLLSTGRQTKSTRRSGRNVAVVGASEFNVDSAEIQGVCKCEMLS